MNYGPLDFLGNIGVLILMVTYLMLQLNRLSSDGLAYSAHNAVGASLVVVSLLYNFNLSTHPAPLTSMMVKRPRRRSFRVR